MIWIDGNTENTESAGSMSCGIGPGVAGCFGFGTWGTESEYEATIWDFTDKVEVGRVSAQTSGQNYMPAVSCRFPSSRRCRAQPVTAWAISYWNTFRPNTES